MAILTSPGIKVLEVDNTAFPPTIDSSVVGLVGFASKGPTNVATLITTPEQLVQTFGNPSENIKGQALEGALEILEATNGIYFVRAAVSANDASAALPIGTCPFVKIGGSTYGLTSSLTLFIKPVKAGQSPSAVTAKMYQFPAGTLNAGTQLQALQTKLPAGTLIGSEFGIHEYNGDAVLVGYDAGRYTSLEVSAFSSVSTYTTGTSVPILQAFALNASGVMVAGAAASAVTAYGTTLSSLTARVNSLYPGEGYNYTLNSDGTIAGNSVETDNDASEYTTFTVNDRGAGLEQYKITLVANDSRYFVESVIPDSSESQSDYIGVDIFSGTAAFANVSSYTQFSGSYTVGTGAPVQSNNTEVVTSGTTISPPFVKLLIGTKNLTGGTNGIPESDTDVNVAIIGTSTDKSGLYALDDDLLNISIAAVPGINTQQIQNELITLAEGTQNFLALVSPGYGEADTVQEAVDWVNGRGGGRTAAINSSWAAAHWPWLQVFSTFDGKDRWYDPVIYAARQMCYTDNVAEPWFAAAGYRRGRLTKPTATEVQLSQGDRDVLYQNNINPIVNFRPEGITIFGQKTLQRVASVLDRINVRRLMIFLRKILLGLGRQYIMEPNDEFTWELVETALNPVLSDIQNRRGLIAYRVICDETVNTPARVARNELWCKIILQPTTVAEFIVFELNLTTQAAKLGL